MLDWPEQWARDEKFWREVATRTVSGVFALVIVGVPPIVYLWLAGRLGSETAFPILIAIVMLGVFAFAWWMLRLAVRALQRWQLARAVRRDANVAARESPSGEELETALAAFLRRRRERGDPLGEAFEETLRSMEGSLYDTLTNSTKSRMERIRAGAALTRTVGPFLIAGVIVLASVFLVR